MLLLFHARTDIKFDTFPYPVFCLERLVDAASYEYHFADVYCDGCERKTFWDSLTFGLLMLLQKRRC